MWIKKAEVVSLKSQIEWWKGKVEFEKVFHHGECVSCRRADEKRIAELIENEKRLKSELTEWKQKYADEVQKRVELAERMNKQNGIS